MDLIHSQHDHDIQGSLYAELVQVEPRLQQDAVDPATALVDLGLDSLSLVAFLARVQERFGLSVAQIRGALRQGCTYHDLLGLCRAIHE